MYWVNVLLVGVLVCCVGGVVGGSDVVDLNPGSFKKEVLESELPYFVEFFAPWCGHCQRLAPEWEKAATNLKGIIPLGKVDCTVHQGLCSQYQVQGYPTIKIFSEKGKVQDYQQARQAAAIVRAATDSLPNRVTLISDISGLEKFLASNQALPHFLIFSSKSEVAPLIKSLAVVFKNRVAFGQVKKDATAVIEQYSVTSFPTILVQDKEQQVHIYDGTVNGEDLKKYIATFAGEAATASPPPPPPAAKPKPKVEVSFTEISEEELNEKCTGLCVLGFVESETVEEKKTVKPEHQTILDSLISKFKSDGKFQFYWVDVASSTGLVSKFSVGGPSVVVFNGKRSKYVKTENLEWNNVFITMEHVLTGDAQYSTL